MPFSGGGSGGSSPIASIIPNASTTLGTITGLINGSNTIFTLPAVPLAFAGEPGLVLWYNGVQQDRVASSPAPGEFTISGAVVTLGTAPVGGDRLNALIFQ